MFLSFLVNSFALQNCYFELLLYIYGIPSKAQEEYIHVLHIQNVYVRI